MRYETFRVFDPARGAFEPVWARNPDGAVAHTRYPDGTVRQVRHADKSAQDRMAVAQRPRVRAWRARQDAQQR